MNGPADTVRLSWRIALRTHDSWLLAVPPAKGKWTSFNSGFCAFLHVMGDVVTDDGSSHPKFHPSKTKLAKVCRVNVETIDKYYAAAKAAKILDVEWTESGTRIKRCQLRFPLGNLPDWNGALVVLRDDRRIRDYESRKPQQTPSADCVPDGAQTESADGVRQNTTDTQTPSADNTKPRQLTNQTPSADSPVRSSTSVTTSMADAVEDSADPARATAAQDEISSDQPGRGRRPDPDWIGSPPLVIAASDAVATDWNVMRAGLNERRRRRSA